MGEHIEVKWSANPASNLWIQDSDRHDRDIAVLVTGSSPNLIHLVIRSDTTKRKKSFGFAVIADD